jgi:colicin import membrane protein
MAGFLREHSGSLAFSVLLHAALAAAFLVAAMITVNRTLPSVQPLPVDGVVIDSAVLTAAQKQLTDRAEAEAARAKAVADARAAAETAATEKAAAEAKQQEDQAEADAKAKVAAQLNTVKAAAAADQARADDAKKRAAAEADKAVAAKRVQDTQRAEEAKRAEDAKRAEQQKHDADAKAADDAKKAADQKAKSEREAELKRQLAEEERVAAVTSGPLRDQYIAQLQARIQRAWIRPPSATVGLDCLVQVTQVPGGEVTSAQVTQCNGDSAARQSIENAVYRASPLPSPADPALFMKSFSFHFHPDQ